MKHIIKNPHNGAQVEAHGVSLAPGHELEVAEPTALALKQTHEFLVHSQVEGKPAHTKAKPKKLAKRLGWSHVTPPDNDPGPQIVVHAEGGKAPKVVAPKKVANVRKPKAKAKGKK